MSAFARKKHGNENETRTMATTRQDAEAVVGVPLDWVEDEDGHYLALSEHTPKPINEYGVMLARIIDRYGVTDDFAAYEKDEDGNYKSVEWLDKWGLNKSISPESKDVTKLAKFYAALRAAVEKAKAAGVDNSPKNSKRMDDIRKKAAYVVGVPEEHVLWARDEDAEENFLTINGAFIAMGAELSAVILDELDSLPDKYVDAYDVQGVSPEGSIEDVGALYDDIYAKVYKSRKKKPRNPRKFAKYGPDGRLSDEAMAQNRKRAVLMHEDTPKAVRLMVQDVMDLAEKKGVHAGMEMLAEFFLGMFGTVPPEAYQELLRDTALCIINHDAGVLKKKRPSMRHLEHAMEKYIEEKNEGTAGMMRGLLEKMMHDRMGGSSEEEGSTKSKKNNEPDENMYA